MLVTLIEIRPILLEGGGRTVPGLRIGRSVLDVKQLPSSDRSEPGQFEGEPTASRPVPSLDGHDRALALTKFAAHPLMTDTVLSLLLAT
jgi:hypothetical protein